MRPDSRCWTCCCSWFTALISPRGNIIIISIPLLAFLGFAVDYCSSGSPPCSTFWVKLKSFCAHVQGTVTNAHLHHAFSFCCLVYKHNPPGAPPLSQNMKWTASVCKEIRDAPGLCERHSSRRRKGPASAHSMESVESIQGDTGHT